VSYEKCLCGDPCCRRCFGGHDRASCPECGPATLAHLPGLCAADERACACGYAWCRRCYPAVSAGDASAVLQIRGELARMKRALEEGDYEVARSAERDIYRAACRAIHAGVPRDVARAIAALALEADAMGSRS
jgi:hypothetical protein